MLCLSGHRYQRPPFFAICHHYPSFTLLPETLFFPPTSIVLSQDPFPSRPSFGQRFYESLLAAGTIALSFFLFMHMGTIVLLLMAGFGLAVFFTSLVDIVMAAVQSAKSLLLPKKSPCSASSSSWINIGKHKDKGKGKEEVAESTTEETAQRSLQVSSVTPEQKNKTTVYQRATTRVEENSDKHLVLSFDLPGVASNQIAVDVIRNAHRPHLMDLKIQAQRGSEDEDDVRLRYHQHFHLQRDCFDFGGVRANLLDGVLTVSIPKKELPSQCPFL